MPEASDKQDVPIPEWFLYDTAPKIREMVEMQVMLACFRLAAEFSETEPIAEARLVQDERLNQALRFDGATTLPDGEIKRGIELALARDTLLAFSLETQAGRRVRWLLIATEENRMRLRRYESGALPAPELPDESDVAGPVVRSRPGVFRLYEQNIGLVTPIIADRLVEALELYPEQWIEDAIGAAVSYNRRNWRYIQRILETWATEGRTNEANRRDQSSTGDFDPERHLSGPYAHIFRRHR